jgi:hypothetical protein
MGLRIVAAPDYEQSCKDGDPEDADQKQTAQ